MKKNILRKHNLPYTQIYPIIKTLELLDIFFTSNFERSCNLDAKTTKNLPRQKLKVKILLLLESFRKYLWIF